MGLSSKQVSSDRNGWNQSLLQGAGTIELPKLSSMKRQPSQQQQQQQNHQQQQPEQLKCPRCDSSNTKFCYYNNYNKSQPRHFCKACKRHWTKGGTLRNVPVGGGRKNKRIKTPTAAAAASKATATTTSGAATAAFNTMTIAQGHHNHQVEDNKSFSEAFCKSFLDHKHNPSSSSLLRESSINFNKGLLLNDGIFMGSTTSLGLLSSQHDDHDVDNHVQFPYLSLLGGFDQSSSNNNNNNNNNNPCSIASTITSVQSPNVYNFTGDNHTHGLEEIMSDHQHHHHNPWTTTATATTIALATTATTATTTSNNVMDNWGWEDIDLSSVPWDDADMKP